MENNNVRAYTECITYCMEIPPPLKWYWAEVIMAILGSSWGTRYTRQYFQDHMLRLWTHEEKKPFTIKQQHHNTRNSRTNTPKNVAYMEIITKWTLPSRKWFSMRWITLTCFHSIKSSHDTWGHQQETLWTILWIDMNALLHRTPILIKNPLKEP